MTRWWLTVALAAIGLLQGAATYAQYLPASQGAAPPPQDPLPISSSGPVMPGPLTPQHAPPGPSPDLGLSPSTPGAFSDCVCAPEHGVYFHVGAQGLRRQGLGNGPLGVIDPQFLDTGTYFVLAKNANFAPNYSDISPNMQFGPRATLGVVWDNCAIEATGFWLPENEGSFRLEKPGRINLFFGNAPLGFEGNNGLWFQADKVDLSLKTTLGSGEVNYRYWNKAVTGSELILGVRYIHLQERLNVFTDDDGLTVLDLFMNPNVFLQANYNVATRNNIVAPQIGFEWQHPLAHWLSFALTGKAGWGVNFVEMQTRLERGDGTIGRSSEENGTVFAHLYELGFFFDIHFLDRMRVRMGYSTLWVLGVAEATDQVDFDLSHPAFFQNTRGSVFYHGPMVEMQLMF